MVDFYIKNNKSYNTNLKKVAPDSTSEGKWELVRKITFPGGTRGRKREREVSPSTDIQIMPYCEQMTNAYDGH